MSEKGLPDFLKDSIEIGRPRWADGTPIGGPIKQAANAEDIEAEAALEELGDDDLDL